VDNHVRSVSVEALQSRTVQVQDWNSFGELLEKGLWRNSTGPNAAVRRQRNVNITRMSFNSYYIIKTRQSVDSELKHNIIRKFPSSPHSTYNNISFYHHATILIILNHIGRSFRNVRGKFALFFDTAERLKTH